MAALLNGPFDANQFNPSQGAGQFDVGKHKVVIETSEVKATQANDGGMLVFKLKAVEGPNAGSDMDYRINLYNASPKAVEIAQRQLSALCHVTGVFHLQDTQQLHGIPFVVEVRKQKNDDRYNEIGKVFDTNGNEPGKGGGQQQQNPGANAFGGNNGQQQQQQNNQQFNGGQQQGQQQQQFNQQQQQNGQQGQNFGGEQSNQQFNQQAPQGGNQQWQGGQQQQQQNGGGQQQQQQPAWTPNNGNAGQQPAWGQQQ